MYASPMDKPTQGSDLRVRLDPALKKQLDDAVAARKTNQQTLVTELVRWYVDQEPMIQSIVIGQIDDLDVVRLVLERWISAREDKPRIAAKEAKPRISSFPADSKNVRDRREK